MRIRTRFAPSPTGQLHLGNARTAIVNWLAARHGDGEFVLRFEDTDVERNVATSESAIMESLDWLGLDRDEDPVAGGPFGPYRQSERLDIYRTYAEKLLSDGRAYRCYCFPEELEARRAAALASGVQPRYDGRCKGLIATDHERFAAEGRIPSIRFEVAPGPIRFEDSVRGEVTIDGSEFGDMVILRPDGRPTYNFAVVVDDMLMEITHVIRGVGHLANTPKQVLLYDAFGISAPEFVHIPMVLAPGGGKLSKREGSPGLASYRDAGYHPFAVVNYLSLLSWSAPGGEEVMTPQELVARMDLDRLGASNAILDLDKMYWLSGQHMRIEPIRELVARVRPFLGPAAGALDDTELERAVSVVRKRVFLFTEVALELDALLAPPEADADTLAALRAVGAAEVLNTVDRGWATLAEWTPESIKKAMIGAGKKAGARGKGLFHPVRAALTGRLQGPELAEVAFLLGPERCAERLGRAVDASRRITD